MPGARLRPADLRGDIWTLNVRVGLCPVRDFAVMSIELPVCVGMTFTQCWHRVPGGSATSILDLASALQGLGEVDVQGVGAGPGESKLDFRPPVPTRRIPLPPSLLYESWRRLRRPSLRTLSEVDLWHLSVPVPPPKLNKPLVATVHDLLPLTQPGYFTRRGAQLMGAGLARIRSEAAAVAVPSEVVATQCIEHDFEADRLHVVPWGFRPLDVTPADTRRVLAEHSISGDFVLFVGTLEPRKGLDTLLAAFKLMACPATLVVVGPHGWGDQPTSATGPATDHVGEIRFLGFVPRGDLRVLQSAATVCCVPSRDEGFGLPALEAMGQGSPLVTTEGTAMAEVAGSAAKIVPVGDSAALATALDEVLADQDLAESMSAAGRRRAAEFTWRRSAQLMTDVYRSVLDRG